ncbi:hypothetical protein [Saccharopolyspora sp. 6V]|uniref:hypothetical protein n=1 Tax=Saccharopolyspora sp. 6V TaxID=2877239 RepID=UPI001CD1D264|nr:hypothetical protein [Saccharopolyspora sp. 6V]MCA1194906.1 hypothetical protein [Saccharopolyspora sp. 6V]
MPRDLIDDLALIAYPPPRPGEVTPPEAFHEAAEQADEERRNWTENLTAVCDETGEDPLLVAVETAASERDQAQLLIRQLVAYGRHVATSRRPAAALAEAAGMDRKTLERHVTDADVAAVRSLIEPTRDEENRSRPLTIEITDDNYWVLTEALREWSYRQRSDAASNAPSEPDDSRLQWAEKADALVSRIKAVN